MRHRETTELVRGALAGDVEAYGELVVRFRDAVFGLCYHRCDDFETARDLAQDTFVRAYQCLGQLAQPERFPGWLRRIAERICIDWRRHRHREARLEDAAERPAPRLEEIAALRVTVQRALSALPEAQRLAVTLFYVNGYSYREIADFLAAPETTVKARLDAGREKLRNSLGDAIRETLQAQRPPDTFREEVIMRVTKVQMKQGVDLEMGGPAAHLVLGDDDRGVAIQIGDFEARSIRAALTKWEPPRPMTYDLMLNALAAFGIRLRGARITGMEGTTVLAEVELTRGKSVKPIDCRPSDAVNLALRADVPVEVDESVLGSIGMSADQAHRDYANLPEYPTEDPDLPPLHQAVVDSDTTEVERLLAEGADPDKPNKHGVTPLRLASMRGEAGAVKLLLSKGADANAKDREGRSALHFAAHFGHQEVIEKLLDGGAEVNAKDAQGATPLHVTTNAEVPRLLLARGADVNAGDLKGRAPLHYAASSNLLEVAQALLSAGADLKARDTEGATPLDVASRSEIRELLREHKGAG